MKEIDFIGANQVTAVVIRELTRIQDSGKHVKVTDVFYMSDRCHAAYITKHEAHCDNPEYLNQLKACEAFLSKYDLLWILDYEKLKQYCYDFLKQFGKILPDPFATKDVDLFIPFEQKVKIPTVDKALLVCLFAC